MENRFPEDIWELYHVREDFSMSTNLAEKHPEILSKLQEVFISEAVKYNVLPLDDRRQELFHIPAARRATPGVIDYGFCAIRLEEARPDPDDSATDAPVPDPAPTVSAEGGAARYPRGFGEMIADPGGDI